MFCFLHRGIYPCAAVVAFGEQTRYTGGLCLTSFCVVGDLLRFVFYA